SIPLPPLIRPVVAGIRKVSRGGRTEMSLQLKPESLGRLSLTVAVEDGRVTARLQAESHAVGRLIESSLGQLKQALQEQGLRLDRLEVAVGESSVQQDLGQQLSRQYQAPPDGSPPRLLMTAGMGEESIAYATKRESAGRCWPNGHIDCLA
ncbi:MAG: flagellar hook-length control protein FliK, partial [Syntrophomonadaceae bacterium]|nr:flagellar hook-length control protein FliK [Syntrophomonadaceae bacterium]